KANKAFDDGLHSKSEAITGPFRETYFQIANDLFDERLKPLIQNIDSRVAARIGDIQNILTGTLDTVKLLVENTNRDIANILTTTKTLISSTLTQVDQEIDKVDCITTNVVQSGDDLAKD